jgi:AcrR family transcriptional regulator
MSYHLAFKTNDKLYIKNPETSDIGRKIVKDGIDLIHEIGFELFTFKKLAIKINSTEATIYRYFENKHRMLLYILSWYWCYVEYQLKFSLQNTDDPETKIKLIVKILTTDLADSLDDLEYNKRNLNKIVIAESSKAYLIKDIETVNNEGVFLPYKDLCAHIANIFTEYNPVYKYPKSLSSTIVEASHFQSFFKDNLPRLTDVTPENNANYTRDFIEDLIFRTLVKLK